MTLNPPGTGTQSEKEMTLELETKTNVLKPRSKIG